MRIGNKDFDLNNKTYIFGILNVTPDSFSDGGRYNETDAALFHVQKMIEEGADIIDVGGESTRPGYTPVSIEEEVLRTAPIIEAITASFDIPVSIDTYKAEVAQSAINAGATVINDIWGLQADDKIADVIKRANATCVLMHNRKEPNYVNFGEDLVNDLSNIYDNAIKSGINEDKIILDPGIGFAKSSEQNLEALRLVSTIKHLGAPVMVAASRKSVIGTVLNLQIDERLEGTLAITAYSVMNGASFVRVHDVKENKRVIDMMEAIIYG